MRESLAPELLACEWLMVTIAATTIGPVPAAINAGAAARCPMIHASSL
jgi:hypothetical protein